MALWICIECGASRSRGATPAGACARCGARPPAWKREPITLVGLTWRLVASCALAVGGFACLAGMWVLWFVCLSGPLRLLQVVYVVVGLPAAGLGAFFLFKASLVRLVQRDHRHDELEGERHGTARTVLGRLVRGKGRATRDASPFMPAAPSVEAVLVFANIRALGPHMGRAMRAKQPKAVDCAVAGALLGLASRGRCELSLRTTRAWQKPEGGFVHHAPERHTVLVRRTARGRAAPLEPGWLENALLAALDALAVMAPRPRDAGLGPYRAGAPVSPPVASGEVPIQVEALVSALTGGRPRARGWLHGILRDEAQRVRAQGMLAPDAEARLGPELVTAFKAQRTQRGQSPAGALLAQVTRGLSSGGPPVPSGSPR